MLNLINFILLSQYTFNKMGRYYIERREILDLFLMYLEDLTIFNSYIKRICQMSFDSLKNSTE